MSYSCLIINTAYIFISYSNEQGAKSVVDEIIYNGLDECKNPRSPGNKIHVIMDDRILVYKYLNDGLFNSNPNSSNID